jgi:hypothetical protein
MNNVKMLLEEILPFYFFIMVMVIMFTSYEPTTFELYIVYAFAFGVSLFNNYLYKANIKANVWGMEILEISDDIEDDNMALAKKILELNRELELINNGSNSTSDGDINNNLLLEDVEEYIQDTKKNGKRL